ncbi:PEP-CTERM sorting domain-containing protein [Anabaena subtropica]|uniref:PEP-CTERM sorting domain-containing protein n=1 Tax=Anabaena subtropica FACHB-260 TaxID=2692884 RepID=A0ABR8CVT5_9NOST|nr:PEP-CTERM sorting domain-containing protein [Anabaena subtropica]MBD2347169.1 PEP-CTERM sorting domain-containing protein [Anabaena subtropica FACHB-260]
MKLFSQVALVAAGFALGVATVDVQSASAAIINYTFTVESPTARGNGSFSFDNANFANQANPMTKVESLFFQFDGDSYVYTEKDDIGYPDFPIVYTTIFSTGQRSLALNYLFNDQANPAISYEIAGEDFTIFPTTSSDGEIISGTVTYSQVPEPTTAISTFVAFSLGLMLNKKAKLIKKLKA